MLLCLIPTALSDPFDLRAYVYICKKCLRLQQAPLLSKLSFLHMDCFGCNQTLKQLVGLFNGYLCISVYDSLISLEICNTSQFINRITLVLTYILTYR